LEQPFRGDPRAAWRRVSGAALVVLTGCAAANTRPAPVVVSIAPEPSPPASSAFARTPGAPGKASASAAGRVAWERAEPDARARARREGRPLLVYVRADWAASSLWMEREVWSDPRIVSAAQAFVALLIDVSGAEGDAELHAQRYGVSKLPTVVLFEREGRRAASLSGEPPVEALLDAMRAASE
jgi:thiol:disulfide interchange protein